MLAGQGFETSWCQARYFIQKVVSLIAKLIESLHFLPFFLFCILFPFSLLITNCLLFCHELRYGLHGTELLQYERPIIRVETFLIKNHFYILLWEAQRYDIRDELLTLSKQYWIVHLLSVCTPASLVDFVVTPVLLLLLLLIAFLIFLLAFLPFVLISALS